jgi:hypothetical protein
MASEQNIEKKRALSNKQIFITITQYKQILDSL